MKKKKLIVCDYDNPKGYTFPSFGFGSSEKRIWHFAKTASELEDFKVVIAGPLWLPEYVPRAKYFPKRLNSKNCDEFLEKYGKFDYLFAGHEYFDKDEWVIPFEKCADILISYQLHPYSYKKVCFDGKKKILFCYSEQMMRDYKDQKPIKALLFHGGVNEESYFIKKSENYLLWIGRIDKDKAPHYAVEVSKILGIPLYILGKTIYQPEYFEFYKEKFQSDNVKMLGVKFGSEKMDIITKASCAIYTLDKNYSEAGAGVLGEILSCGVPIAGMTWVGNDAICEAVDDDKLGKVIDASKIVEDEIPLYLSEAVKYCLKLDREKVYEFGSRKYNPHKLVKNLLDIVAQIRECN
ncbi:glycosyltransferase [Patescibacteria group bacterium]|nr:glycosyltransferase [Patescibacteria group bacterium]